MALLPTLTQFMHICSSCLKKIIFAYVILILSSVFIGCIYLLPKTLDMYCSTKTKVLHYFLTILSLNLNYKHVRLLTLLAHEHISLRNKQICKSL